MGRIHGRRIMLREYRKEDLPCIRQWVNDNEVVVNLSDIFLYPHSLENTEEFLQSSMKSQGRFVIAHENSGDYIGQIDLIRIDWKNRIAEMGIVIGNKENWCKGYGEEAIKLLQEFVFNDLNLNKLRLSAHAFNKRAISCYTKCGFIEEGRLREAFYNNGEYSDYIIMGILRREWQERVKESI